MKQFYTTLALLLFILSCKSGKVLESSHKELDDDSSSIALVAFGSCNKYDLKNVFWDDIAESNADVFIWGGDNIYADTDDMDTLRNMYAAQNNVPEYAALREKVLVTGTWDDHDYGINDGGVEFMAKKGSQQAFLDFMDVEKNDPRRNREGVYSSQLISKPGGVVKIINLDTRYFRSPLTDSKTPGQRYKPNRNGEGTILGKAQWAWLESELSNSKADFNLIVTSIQFLSNEHGFEKWANFPHEIDKMKQVLIKTKAKGVIFLSGDRHISEFSKTNTDGLSYPLIDFTSSGLTHAYANFSGEPNPFRVGDVIFSESYGVLEINLNNKEVTFKMMGDEGKVLQQIKQTY